jgi:hypothetical protein
MSGYGPSLTCADVQHESAFGGSADVVRTSPQVADDPFSQTGGSEPPARIGRMLKKFGWMIISTTLE